MPCKAGSSGELAKAISTNISEIKEDPKLNSAQKEEQIARLEDFGQAW